MATEGYCREVNPVAPFVGAWIETSINLGFERKLRVAPFVGAWIETMQATIICASVNRRTLCGCVD